MLIFSPESEKVSAAVALHYTTQVSREPRMFTRSAFRSDSRDCSFVVVTRSRAGHLRFRAALVSPSFTLALPLSRANSMKLL